MCHQTVSLAARHLEENGALLLNLQAEYASPEGWALRLRENRRALPEPWPETGSARIASDGSEHYG